MGEELVKLLAPKYSGPDLASEVSVVQTEEKGPAKAA